MAKLTAGLGGQTGRHLFFAYAWQVIGAMEIEGRVDETDNKFLIDQVAAASAAFRQFILEMQRDAVLAAAKFIGREHARCPQAPLPMPHRLR